MSSIETTEKTVVPNDLRPASSPQEFFERVARHLAGMKRRAATLTGTCRYRTSDGKTCAAGCQIPDKYYSHHMENTGIRVVVEKYPELKVFFPDIYLACDLQLAHDEPLNWNDGEGGFSGRGWQRLRNIATEYGLTFPEDVIPS